MGALMLFLPPSGQTSNTQRERKEPILLVRATESSCIKLELYNNSVVLIALSSHQVSLALPGQWTTYKIMLETWVS